MKHIAFVTGADRGLGLALTEGLLERDWSVFAGQYMPEWEELSALSKRYHSSLHLVPLDVESTDSVRAAANVVAGQSDRVDLLINNAALWGGYCDLGGTINYEDMVRLYNVNALGPLRMVDAFLPLTSAGLKRLAFVSSEAGSIGAAKRTGKFDYCMSKAALNMAVKLIFNRLRPEGYTSRLYQPGVMRTYLGGKRASGGREPGDAAALALEFFLNPREDEDHLVMVSEEGKEFPW